MPALTLVMGKAKNPGTLFRGFQMALYGLIRAHLTLWEFRPLWRLFPLILVDSHVDFLYVGDEERDGSLKIHHSDSFSLCLAKS